MPLTPWYSPDCTGNTTYLVANYPAVFQAFSGLDQLGHSVLECGISSYRGEPWETTVGLALLRRAVTQFAGVRYLCERSSVQPASLVLRSLFETLLATRYLVYGTKRWIHGASPTTAKGREVRARYYRTEELRREIYRRQAALDGRLGLQVRSAKTRADIQDEIDVRRRHLDRHFPSQQRAFGRLRCFPPGAIKHFDHYPWYAFGFGSARRDQARTLRGLAQAFGWEKDYEMLYDSFSGFAHVRGLHHDTEVDPGSIAVRVPHAPDDFEVIVYFALNWQLLMLSYLSRVYCPAARAGVGAVHSSTRPVLDALHGRLPLGIT